MNKSELIACVANVVGSKAQAGAVLNAFLAVLTETLSEGEAVVLPDFGTFKVVQRQARQGRNPQTGATIEIPACNAIKFLPDAPLKKEMTDYTL